MKKSIFGIIVCLVLLCQGAFAKDNKITLVDYANLDKGGKVPEWFIKVHGKNPKSSDFKEIIPDYDENMIFVVGAKGGSLDFLETFFDFLYIENELMNHIMSNIVSDYGVFESSRDLERIIGYYSAAFSNIRLVGLDIIESFWGVFDETDANGNVVNSYCEYYQVFSVPKTVWTTQISYVIDMIPVGKSKIEKYIKESVEDMLLSRPLVINID